MREFYAQLEAYAGDKFVQFRSWLFILETSTRFENIQEGEKEILFNLFAIRRVDEVSLKKAIERAKIGKKVKFQEIQLW